MMKNILFLSSLLWANVVWAQGVQLVGDAQMNMQPATHLYMQTGSNTLNVGNGTTLSGVGTITGNVLNNGTIQVGNPTGTITINGDLNNQATLNMQLAGIGANEYDLIVVNGSGIVEGTINVSYLSGYVLATPAPLDIITTTGLTYNAIENSPPTAPILNTATNVYLGLGVYLSATLTPLKATRQNETQVRLDWGTTQDANNQGFEVEFKNNSQDFEKIAFVAPKEGQGTKNYTLLVPNTEGGYFRIKQLDHNGKFAYSNVAYIGGTETMFVYPNPNKGIFKVMAGKPLQNAPARLLNTQGTIVWEGTLEGSQAEIQAPNLPNGLYVLRILSEGKTKALKVVIEK